MGINQYTTHFNLTYKELFFLQNLRVQHLGCCVWQQAFTISIQVRGSSSSSSMIEANPDFACYLASRHNCMNS
jgi:hypothetical protein